MSFIQTVNPSLTSNIRQDPYLQNRLQLETQIPTDKESLEFVSALLRDRLGYNNINGKIVWSLNTPPNDPVLLNYLYNIIKNFNINQHNIFSKISNPDQCNGVGLGKSPKTGDICYLCGLQMYSSTDCNKFDWPPEHPFRPECEHILPYIYGALILELVNSSQTTKQQASLLQKLEYKWAHKCCNRLKSQGSFVDIKNFKIETDEDQIKKFKEFLVKKTNIWNKGFLEWGASLNGVTEEQIKEHVTKWNGINKTVDNIVNILNSNEIVDPVERILNLMLISTFMRSEKLNNTKIVININNSTANLLPVNINSIYEIQSIDEIKPIFQKWWNQLTVQQAGEFLDASGLIDALLDPSTKNIDMIYNSFGKKNKLSLISNTELKNKLKSVGINITKLSRSGKRLPLTRKELEQKALMFKNLQIQAKKYNIRIMYKSKKQEYIYKSYNRLINEINRKLGKK